MTFYEVIKLGKAMSILGKNINVDKVLVLAQDGRYLFIFTWEGYETYAN